MAAVEPPQDQPLLPLCNQVSALRERQCAPLSSEDKTASEAMQLGGAFPADVSRPRPAHRLAARSRPTPCVYPHTERSAESTGKHVRRSVIASSIEQVGGASLQRMHA